MIITYYAALMLFELTLAAAVLSAYVAIPLLAVAAVRAGLREMTDHNGI